MGILDTIVNNVTRSVSTKIQNSVNNAAYKATSSVGQNLGKGISNSVTQATVNADDAIKKISFSKNSAGGYDLFYDLRKLPSITKSDLNFTQGKKRADAVSMLKIILRPKHDVFKNDKVATTIAERMADDIGIKV